ncbi:MAG: signal transduction histidine kinase LytS [Gemmatimonadetes bacterium]|nr:signal transduction histidine kinase LytS [Gemmatimonadota bacterium]
MSSTASPSGLGRRPFSTSQYAALLCLVWSVPSAFAIVERYAYDVDGVAAPAFWRVFAAKSVGWYAWAVMTPFIFGLARRFPLRVPLVRRAVLTHVAGCTGACTLHAVIWSLGNWLGTPDLPGTYLSLLRHGLLAWLPISVTIYAGLVGGAHWMFLSRESQERERRTAALEGQLLRAQLQALRMQLQPHFLFNTLHTIAVLIRERDTSEAVRLIACLGDVLRAVLQADDKQEVSLFEELTLTRQYLEIEEARFADRLHVSWNVQDGVGGLAVPYLILQPLVENALRHGVSQLEKGGHVEIGARLNSERLLLWVRDTGPGVLPTVGTCGGIGLRNTRQRLLALYDGEGSLVLETLPFHCGGGCRAQLDLPCKLTDHVSPIAAAPWYA